MTDFANGNFTNEVISLDGNKYKGCTFTDCELFIGASAPFGLINNDFNECRWTFTGSAALTINILAGLYQMSPETQQLVKQTFKSIRGRGSEGITVH